MGKTLFFSVMVLVWMVSAAFATDGCGAGPCANCHSLTLKEANELLRGVGEVKKISLAPVNGLWLLELARDGRQGVVFMDFGKKNLIAGTVFPLKPGQMVQQEAKQETNREVKPPAVATGSKPDVSAIPLDNSLVMGNPRGKTRLFVFTDPDCPFCARLHGELKKLVAMEPDLAVYVKLFPLKIHPGSYDKARIILGGGSLELLDRTFAGAALPKQGADYGNKGVEETIKLAESIGINATPTLVLPDGRIMPGFREAAALKELLDQTITVSK